MILRKEDRRLTRFIVTIMALTMGFLLFAFFLSSMRAVLIPIIVFVGLPILWLISGGYGLICVVRSFHEIAKKGVTRRTVYLRLALGIVLLWLFIYAAYYFHTYGFTLEP